MLRAKACPTAARIRQPICAASSPALCARQRVRAHPTPSASAPRFPTTWRPAPPPSRARRVRGGWPGRADERIEPATHTHICDATTGRSERSRDRWRFVKALGGKRTFFEQQVQHRVDGGRRPKSRPLSSALRGIEALLAVVEVGALLHSVISPTLETGLRTQHRPGEARSRWDGQKASSCEQPVGVARAGDSAPLVDRSGRSEALSSAHHAQ